MPTDDLDQEARRRSARGRKRDAGTPLALSTDEDHSFRLLPAGLAVEGDLDLSAWSAAVGRIATVQNGMLWALGDLILYGVAKFGHDARDILGATGYAGETERKAEYVCRRFPTGRRLPELSFDHHRAVASLAPPVARRLLRRAVQEKLSTRALRALVRELKASTDAPEATPSSGLSRRDLERLPAACTKFGLAPELVLALLRELRS